MDMLLILAILVIGLVALDLGALTLGADSRDPMPDDHLR